MPKYLLLYNSTISPGEMMAGSTPEQMQAGMDAWMAWAAECGDALVDLGSPLGGGRTVTADGASASDSQAAGFSVLEAGSIEEATALVEGHPHFMTPGEPSIVVLEYLPVPGM